MAESTLTAVPPASAARPGASECPGRAVAAPADPMARQLVAGVALAWRALFLVLLGPVAMSLAGKVQGGGGPSMASFAGAALFGPARNADLFYVGAAVLALLVALAITPRRR